MSAKQPEVDVASALATALSLAVGTDIKYGPARPSSETGNDAVRLWVTPYGGPPPEPYLNGAVDGSIFKGSVQVLCVATTNPDSAAEALALGRSVRDALHLKAPSGYLGCWALSSEPLPYSPDDAGRCRVVINLSLWWQYVA